LNNYGHGNAINFAEYIDELSAWRDLKGLRDCIIVLDNVAFHHTDAVLEMIEISGFEVKFLPPYTPYFNPIENFFSQWKNLVKRERPRDLIEIYRAINQIRDNVTIEECNNYINNCALNCYNYTQGQRVFEN
jgi:transposase